MKKRILTLALVLALLATCFAGTYAYLKDTKAVKNTFTTGNVYITLDEAQVTGDGKGNLVADGTTRITTTAEANSVAQSYHLFPGMTVTKDPTITLNAGSENAWIAAKVTVSDTEVAMLQYLSGGALKDGTADVVIDGNVAYIFVKVAMTENQSVTLFELLSIPAEWDNKEMDAIENMKIDVTAYAVQANGFATCQAAMQAAYGFPAQNS